MQKNYIIHLHLDLRPALYVISTHTLSQRILGWIYKIYYDHNLKALRVNVAIRKFYEWNNSRHFTIILLVSIYIWIQQILKS